MFFFFLIIIFLIYLRYIVRIFMYSFTSASCTLVLWPFLHTCTLFLYIWWWCMFYSPIFPCVVSFLSLYICFYMYAISIFVSHMMPWWVLFKCFRKTGYESLPCHELSSCKVFQEFVLGLYSLYSTSDYEFKWFMTSFMIICFCGFVTNCQRGRLLGTYFM